jgi:hypothetical protein
MIWLNVVEVYVDESAPGKVTFKTGTGLSNSFMPLRLSLACEMKKISAWQLESVHLVFVLA